MEEEEALLKYEERSWMFRRDISLRANTVSVVINKKMEFKTEEEFGLSEISPKYSTVIAKKKELQSVVVVVLLLSLMVVGYLLMQLGIFTWMYFGAAFLVYVALNGFSFLFVKEIEYVVFQHNSGTQAFAIGKTGGEVEKFKDFVSTLVRRIERANT